MAIASLVFGVFWMFGLGSILAVIFGLIAKKQIDESGGTQGGEGMAIAGLVLGLFGVAMLLIVIIILAAASSSVPQYPAGT
jgi:ABC-type phosphate transport system permease subunit